MRRGRLAATVAAGAAALVLSAASVASAVTIGTTPTLTSFVVGSASGDQTDPHVSGSLVSYTSSTDVNRIRYHDVASSADAVVPNSGEDDFLSDISGNAIVFTRVGLTSTIYVYDVGSSSAIEVAPSATASRRDPAIGNNTVAWQDFSFRASALEPEIVTYDRSAGTSTRLTNDAMLDRNPAVSPDGLVVVWIKCNTSGTACDVYKAVRAGTTWTTSAVVTAAVGEESSPDSNGSLIAYASTRAGETDIYFQPVAGGTETRLALAGAQTNPSISGDVITFDSRDASGQSDIYAYRISTDTLWQLTTISGANESLNDVWVSPAGQVRVVWQSDATGDFNVYGVSFLLPAANVVDTIPELVDLVRSFNLQQGIANSLDAKLENANKALEKAKAGDTVSACNLINAFLNEVDAQDGQELTAEQAGDLRDAAALIKSALGCS